MFESYNRSVPLSPRNFWVQFAVCSATFFEVMEATKVLVFLEAN